MGYSLQHWRLNTKNHCGYSEYSISTLRPFCNQLTTHLMKDKWENNKFKLIGQIQIYTRKGSKVKILIYD